MLDQSRPFHDETYSFGPMGGSDATYFEDLPGALTFVAFFNPFFPMLHLLYLQLLFALCLSGILFTLNESTTRQDIFESLLSWLAIPLGVLKSEGIHWNLTFPGVSEHKNIFTLMNIHGAYQSAPCFWE